MRYLLSLLAVVVLVASIVLTGCSVMESSRIEQAVLKALGDDSQLAQYTFEVSYQGEGRVQITGTVYTPEEVDKVMAVASAVEGVAQVLNRVTVEEYGSGLIQDEVVVTPFL